MTALRDTVLPHLEPIVSVETPLSWTPATWASSVRMRVTSAGGSSSVWTLTWTGSDWVIWTTSAAEPTASRTWASVTGLVNRRERKGFARRIANPSDRRSILVEVDPERVYAAMAPLFADWVGSLQELYAGYTDEQLEVILHFLNEAARRQREATARLTE